MTITSLFVDIFDPLPAYPTEQKAAKVPHAPKRPCPLNRDEKIMAVRNALRYVPKKHHQLLAKEFVEELEQYGHIYAFRFMPNFHLKVGILTLLAVTNPENQLILQAPSLSEIPAKSQQAAAIILMILNNLDPEVAQFPQELVTYGGNGQVFSNWIQFRLVLRYLAQMSVEQTLVLYSGHPLGLFPSHANAPRVTITNGMVSQHWVEFLFFHQMWTPGICLDDSELFHETVVRQNITIMNAGRRYLNVSDLTGKVFVTAGLGGMSGAQPKAATIAGCISVTAEVIADALLKRYNQGWIDEYSSDLSEIINLIRKYRKEKKTRSIGYLGNIVDLWERLAAEPDHLVDLGSDQTSLHNPFLGGYYPVGISVEDANKLMTSEPEHFKKLVQRSLLRHIAAIDTLAARGMHFWDYGNAFLVECQRAGANMRHPQAKDDKTFRYPSYMQDIMGDIFSMGFGPFRWVCTSQKSEDLEKTDKIACEVIRKLMEKKVPEHVRQQYLDNKKWIESAAANRLVVGSQARILYSDQEGRIAIALAFNDAVRDGRISASFAFVFSVCFFAPIVLSRDHHDVSGTDSPFRETSNIMDGSALTADMAVQNVIGDSFRGATWVSLHNGGGVGWGDVINGGFGMLLDGSQEAAKNASEMLQWDVSNGVARRSWSGNEKAREAIIRTQAQNKNLVVTIPYDADDQLLERFF
ncbi:urocanate hydratase [Necator americanus]|uniref:Urocanate hydratase n=1 Tax=Necator americanus TaxID=51031 RepID=W2T9N6_NECAM|nr:urocanate hydratase [Necator americanus]ETN78583.1 urocanate hydratase [Necator americanus]